LEREGVDLKVEMEQKMKEMEELWRKEKEEATQAFQQERKKYEDQIETLQKQVGGFIIEGEEVENGEIFFR
jgi:kinesin family protein 1